MAQEVQEGCLKVLVSSDCTIVRFDGQVHCATHTFKAVDFVVQCDNGTRWLAMEIKGGEIPCNPNFNEQSYGRQIRSKQFIDDLVTKFRDSLLYVLLQNCALCEQERIYLVILVLPKSKSIDKALLLALNDKLRSRLPVNMPNRCRGLWQRPLAAKALIATPEEWNAKTQSGLLGDVKVVV